jgi:hypothetical protein
MAAIAGGGIIAVGVIAFAASRGSGSGAESSELAPPPPPTPAPAPEQIDPVADVAVRTKDVFTKFVAWSRDHRDAPCPDLAALGDSPRDPWGRPFRLTCADQPDDQMIGAISAGPDGRPGTPDDIASWKLGRDVTDLVRGARWSVTGPPVHPPANLQPGPSTDPKRKPVPATTRSMEARPSDPREPTWGSHSDGIELDEFGIPIKRKR